MSVPLSALRVAIVGAGPGGFYAAESLQKADPGVRIDMFDRLPTPYGLVRGGVAPDHPKIKSVTRVFDRIASHHAFRYFGNVLVGRTLSTDELHQCYDVVLYATGAETDRSLGIPGETLTGSHAATELVGWYNGHPDFVNRRFDFTARSAVVIGIGNVAMDAVRILARTPDSLAGTDITAAALAELRSSRLETIHIIARRGPVQAACTAPELKELGELEGVDVVVDPRDLELDPVSAADLARSEDRGTEKIVDLLREFAARPLSGAPRRIIFHFFTSPVEILGEAQVTGIRLQRNRLERDGRGGVRAVPVDGTEVLPAGLVFRSVGYRGVPIPGLPFDERLGVVPNVGGRVVESTDSATPVRGVYVAGWIKRGPVGVIGTNKACAAETVDLILADAAAGRLPRPVADVARLESRLRERGVVVTTWTDWQALDREERSRGESAGRPREKVTSIPEMLDLIDRHRTA